MKFPVFVHLGPWRLHPHVVFELLAYAVGFGVYRWLRGRNGDAVPGTARWSILIAALLGAAVGSRVLSGLEDPAVFLAHWRDLFLLRGGKTIVGGLIGGLIAVEWIKHRIGVQTRTGDLLAIPLALGVAIGRVGCFLTGLDDQTYGTPTALWTGVDFGDGIRRHPTQLYEIGFLLCLMAVLTRVHGRLARPGDEFRLFIVGYFAFRLFVDVLKPAPAFGLGLSTLQWASVVMLVYCVPDVARWARGWRTSVAGSPATTV